ncbi:PhoB family transcriptional regulator [Paenibacillus sp. IHB B 3415]|uniref:response regulator transcription factor n=1 Tax=Paenibacillus sp. IHB B 3415 TaxID=867080 RepID=UPI000573812A|nr:response regulator transcription factor [Paenibacillus sp. IHB B 3415]KHL97137.1 PhoB family transcriptional regulator [Paenibacillus sp. IHB B 3415]
MIKIFIIEDDSVIAEKIKQHLENWGYEAAIVQDFRKVLPEFIAFDPQLILMDVSLPCFSGYYWCGEIRKMSKVPIIFVSSASDNMNIVRAVDMGGDDYITKPFDFQVLMAKVQAMLRRTYDFGDSGSLMEHNGLIFNLSNTTITYDGQKQELTKNEARILQKLMENRGKIVKRDKLMMSLWETENFVDDSALYTNINRLRKKLEQLGLADYISTKKGEGYLIEG